MDRAPSGSRSTKPSTWPFSTITFLTALRTTIQQSEAEEITQGLRPNPTLFADWEYLPFASPAKQNPGLYSGQSTPDYLKNNTEGDIGLSYLIERGGKRLDRLQAQKDITAQTRSLVADSERGLSFQVATLFYNAQLAESTHRSRRAGPQELPEHRGHQRTSVPGRRLERKRFPDDQTSVVAI